MAAGRLEGEPVEARKQVTAAAQEQVLVGPPTGNLTVGTSLIVRYGP